MVMRRFCFIQCVKMDSDLKVKMDQDLRKRLDRLFLMKTQPRLHLSNQFDEIISKVDYDAERLMLELESDPTPYMEGEQSAEEVNRARCEFVRIFEVLRNNLYTRLLATQTVPLDETFKAVDKRVNEFLQMNLSQGRDINDLEDGYVQLVLEIREMSNEEESKIFNNQSIFYLSSDVKRRFGGLFHLTGVCLNTEQIGCLE